MTSLPACCQSRGIRHLDGTRSCPRHATTDQRLLLEKLEQQALQVITGGQGWPEGPRTDVAARQGMLEWAARHQLRLATTRCQELHWLDAGRCQVMRCQRLGAWMSNVTRWTHQGKPALILAQPYDISDDDMLSLQGLGRRYDVAVAGACWYSPATMTVQVRRP